MSELGKETRELLAAARGGEDPTDEDRGVVKSGLMARIAGAAAVGAATTAASQTGAAAGSGAAGGMVAAGKSLFLVKIAGGMLVGAAVVGGGAVHFLSRSEVPESPAAAVSTAAPATSGKAVALESAAKNEDEEDRGEDSTDDRPTTEATEPQSKPPRAQRSASAPPAKPGLGEESRALADVQRALRDGEGDKALSLLDRQSSKYKHGALGEERAAARVFALCNAGRRSEARAAARKFLGSFPRSPQADRVRAACADE